MKVYRFYQKPDDAMKDYYVGRNFSIREKYPLYALTNDKKLAKEFENTRDMKCFIKRSCHMDKEEYSEYISCYRNRVINHYTFESFANKNTEFVNRVYATVVCTENEVDYVTESSDSGGILHYMENWVPVDILKKKYRDELIILKYDVAALFCGGCIGQPGMRNSMYDTLYDLDIKLDQLGVFIMLYGDTLSDQFYKSISWSTKRPDRK